MRNLVVTIFVILMLLLITGLAFSLTGLIQSLNNKTDLERQKQKRNTTYYISLLAITTLSIGCVGWLMFVILKKGSQLQVIAQSIPQVAPSSPKHVHSPSHSPAIGTGGPSQTHYYANEDEMATINHLLMSGK